MWRILVERTALVERASTPTRMLSAIMTDLMRWRVCETLRFSRQDLVVRYLPRLRVSGHQFAATQGSEVKRGTSG